MRWKRGGISENIEDRRGEGAGAGGFPIGGRGAATMGVGTMLLLLVLSLVFGQDFLSMVQDGAVVVGPGGAGVPGAAPAGEYQTSPEEQEQVEFVSFVLDDTQGVWSRAFGEMGLAEPYQDAKLVLFRDVVRSGCGFAEAAMGPFYCPADEKVYIDLGFYDELRRRFGAAGDFAEAYVISHELGHHVQNRLGISAQVQRLQQARPAQANELSVRLELQADCLAGLWAHSTEQRQLLETGDVEEALNAAAAVGDDRIQAKATGYVNPETWTHGSSEQRAEWFMKGLTGGDVQACDTFGWGMPPQ